MQGELLGLGHRGGGGDGRPGPGRRWAGTQAHGVHDEAGKVLDALRTAGWRPVLRIKDIEITRAGPLPGRDPAQSADI